MLETFKNYILGEWQVISQVPGTIAVFAVLIGLILWAMFNWAYGRVIENRASEISLLERQNKDYALQVDMLQKKPATAVGGELLSTADLVLQTYGDERSPTRLSYDNIWRWYYLRMIMIGIEKDTGKEHRNAVASLYVNFDKPVMVGTLEVSAHGFTLPRYEVKEFTNRYAIVVFSQELPEGTVRVRVY
jgi:hypothetical protein